MVIPLLNSLVWERFAVFFKVKHLGQWLNFRAHKTSIGPWQDLLLLLLPRSFVRPWRWQQMGGPKWLQPARRPQGVCLARQCGADGFYVFAGRDRRLMGDLHFYDRKANQWSEVTPAGTAPGPREGHRVVWAPEADGFYVFGGQSGGYRNELHFYNRQANQWTKVTPAGTAPAGRMSHAAVWAPGADGFYVFAGRDRRLMGDLHFYDRKANQWSEVTPAGTAPGPREGHRVVWAPEADGFYVFGGQSVGYRNELHFYNRQANQWTKVTPAGTAPAGRMSRAAVWGWWLLRFCREGPQIDGGSPFLRPQGQPMEWGDSSRRGSWPSRGAHSGMGTWGWRFPRLWWAKRWLQERAAFFWPAVHNVNRDVKDNDLHDNEQNLQDDDHWNHYLDDGDHWDHHLHDNDHRASKQSDFNRWCHQLVVVALPNLVRGQAFVLVWRHYLRWRGALEAAENR